MNTWITALKHFYAFCIDKLQLPIKDYAAKLDRPRQDDLDQERRVYKPLSPETFTAIIGEAIRQQDYAWAIAARFKWETISRIGDLYNLRWEDVAFERKQVTCRQPKRGGPKTKVLYDDLLKDLRRLKELDRAGPQDPVFRRSDQSRHAFRQWFHRHLKKHAKGAGCKQYVHPHLIRASAATALSEAGVPTRSIMLQGGWDSEKSLQAYLRDDLEAHRERLREVLDL